MLRVAVTSLYGGLLGAYVLDDGVLRWEGERRDPFASHEQVIEGRVLRRAILAEDGPGTWITPEDDPERWLRRLPGFLAMRGHMTAEVVRDERQPRRRPRSPSLAS